MVLSANKSAPVVLLAGQYQNGKSTLVNCLLSGCYAIEGDGLATTATRTKYSYSDGKDRYYQVSPDGSLKLLRSGVRRTIDRSNDAVSYRVEANVGLLKEMTLIDAPGWGSGDGDDKQAALSLDGVDFVVYLAQQRQLSDADRAFLKLLRKRRTYFSVLLNVLRKTDPSEPDPQQVCAAIEGVIKQCGVNDQFIRFPSPSGICAVNLLWAKYGAHLLDEPVGQREKEQLAILQKICADDGSGVGLTHSDIARLSGFNSWIEFLKCAVELVPSFRPPQECDLHKRIVDSLCGNLISIMEGA